MKKKKKKKLDGGVGGGGKLDDGWMDGWTESELVLLKPKTLKVKIKKGLESGWLTGWLAVCGSKCTLTVHTKTHNNSAAK
jgi:hypothetical protein